MISSSATRPSGRIFLSAVATDPQRQRLFLVQRAQTKAQLEAVGMDANLAERWLAAWEGSSNMDAERQSVDFWERGRLWIAQAWQAGHKPPTIEAATGTAEE